MQSAKRTIALKNDSGDIVIFALVFMSIFLIMAAGLLGVVNMSRKFTLQKESKVHAFEIAEAGINYYRWHLAHNSTDYCDGLGAAVCAACVASPPCGPYTHDYNNDVGQKIGSFELLITPPQIGSTVVIVQSIGWVDKYPNVKKTIITRFGIPSLAEYSFLQDAPMNFSATSITWGKVHSNYQIEFNGINHSTVMSAETSNGVWTTNHGVPNEDLWDWPVPNIDFNKVTIDLSKIKIEACPPTSNGICLELKGAYKDYPGYHLEFLADGTLDIHRVNSNDSNYNITNESLLENRSLTNINLIFVANHTWVDGIIPHQITVAAAYLPEKSGKDRNIYIPGNITYTSRDASHILGLIAQKSIILSKNVPTNMTIEAHLLAQKGSISRDCYTPVNNSLTIYGGMVSKTGGGFKCGNPVWGGFLNTYYYANPDAIYHPPPKFPISTTSTLLSWEEVE